MWQGVKWLCALVAASCYSVPDIAAATALFNELAEAAHVNAGVRTYGVMLSFSTEKTPPDLLRDRWTVASRSSPASARTP